MPAPVGLGTERLPRDTRTELATGRAGFGEHFAHPIARSAGLLPTGA